MKIEILKSIAGSGDFVKGSERQFALDRGMIVEVEDSVATKWIASDIAKPIAFQPETAMLETPPETTMRPRAKTKPRKGIR